MIYYPITLLWCGVDIFFVLSGFLITSILLESRVESYTNYYLSFLIRRSLRIFPLYYVCLAVFLIVLPYIRGGRPIFPAAQENQIFLWFYLTNFCSDGLARFEGLAHAWSLAVEEQFYLVWPAVIYWVPEPRLRPAIRYFLVGGFILCIALYALHGFALFPYIRWWGMLLGAYVAISLHYNQWKSMDQKLWARFSVGAAFFSCAILIGFFEELVFVAIGAPLLDIATAGFIVLSIQGAIPSFCAPTWARSVGKYSYFLYLFHFPLRGTLFQLYEPIAKAFSAITISSVALHIGYALYSLMVLLILAMLSYRLLEKPLIQLGRKWSSRPA